MPRITVNTKYKTAVNTDKKQQKNKQTKTNNNNKKKKQEKRFASNVSFSGHTTNDTVKIVTTILVAVVFFFILSWIAKSQLYLFKNNVSLPSNNLSEQDSPHCIKSFFFSLFNRSPFPITNCHRRVSISC